MSAYSQDNPAVRRQFEKIDWDKDGVISKEDLKAFLAQVGATPSAQYRKALFKEADLDHKGLITYADFVELVTRIRQGETLEWGPLLDHATRSLKKNTLLRQLARGAGEFFGVSDSFTLTSSGRWGTMGYFDRTADRPDLSKEPHGAEEEEEEESAAPRGGTLARAQDFLRRIPGIFQQHQGDQQDQQQRHEARDLGREEKLHGMASPETASPDEPPVDESKVKDKEAKRKKKNKHRAAQSQEPSGLQEITVRTESEPLELGDDGGALAPESIATLPLQDGAEVKPSPPPIKSEADLSRARPAPEPLAGSEGQEPGPSEQPSEQPSSAPAKHKKPKKSSKHGKRAASHEMHEINPSDLLAASDHSIDLSNPPSMQLSELIALQEPSAPGRSTSALSLNAVPVTQLEDLEQPTTVVFSSECSTSSRKLSRTWKSIRGKRPAELPEVSIEPPSPVRPTAQSVFHPDPSPSVAFSSAQALPARTPEGLETLVEISEGNTLVPTVERRGRRRSGTAGSRGSARLQAFTRSFTTLLRDPKVRKFMLREKSWPIFTVLVIIAQLTLLSLGLYYQRGIDDFYNNPFIGPSQSILRSLGARYTPCMRDLTPSTRAKFEVQSLDDPIACPLDYSGPSNGTECTFFDAVEHICGMGGFHSSVPDQGFRLLTANFLHAGVIHLLIVLLFEIRVGMHVEREIGSIRTFLIFTISGVAGHLLAAIMSPNSTTTGASGAVFGLVSLLFIDILQNWPLLKRPKFNLGILSFVTLLTFLAGLLPAIDNYAHIGGFVAGTLCGFIFVPSVNLGKRDAKRKRILLAISVPALLLYLGLLFGLFYGGADGGNCKSCQAIECLPLNSPWCGI